MIGNDQKYLGENDILYIVYIYANKCCHKNCFELRRWKDSQCDMARCSMSLLARSRFLQSRGISECQKFNTQGYKDSLNVKVYKDLKTI